MQIRDGGSGGSVSGGLSRGQREMSGERGRRNVAGASGRASASGVYLRAGAKSAEWKRGADAYVRWIVYGAFSYHSDVLKRKRSSIHDSPLQQKAPAHLKYWSSLHIYLMYEKWTFKMIQCLV